MKTVATITLDYAKARIQADKLEELAAELSSLSKKDMETARQELSANWKGTSAAAFLSKAELLQADMKKTAQEISDIAAQIRKIAQTLYKADMAAAEVASTLGGGS